nr:immunoglobulin heavy chain junction region [Mus musculus]
ATYYCARTSYWDRY